MQAMTKIFTMLAGMFLVTESALALDAVEMPEPGILGLLVAGGIVGVVFAIRKRRK